MRERGDASEKDDFWSVERLIPCEPKPRAATARAYYDTSAVEVCSDSSAVDSSAVDSSAVGSSAVDSSAVGSSAVGSSDGGSHGDAERRLSAPAIGSASPPRGGGSGGDKSGNGEGNGDLEFEYVPVSPLIGHVRVLRWRNSYNYYEEFRRDALRLLSAEGSPCRHVAFFSYVPQYVQLSDAQLAYYLYWRSEVKRGRFPSDVDYSYVLLYIFELINLGDAIAPSHGQAQLCAIWENYRKIYPRLDRYLSDWICDYSLIHRLPPPAGMCDLGIADLSSLKEFYIYYGDGDGLSIGYAHALIRFCSSYDYKKSKFAAGEALPLYEKHLPGALAAVIERCSGDGMLLSSAALRENRVTRDAYSGALCASGLKRRLEISFYSFSRSHELRFLVADVLKYAENKLRAYLGIRSRLGVFGLPKSVTEAADAYFAAALPTVRAAEHASASARVPEYEKLYDVPHVPLSPKNAAAIEERSWDTTKRLVEAFEDPTAETAEIAATPIEQTGEADGETGLCELLGHRMELVNAALNGDLAAERAIAERESRLLDSLADEINEIAADAVGDVILEAVDGGYAVIEEYRELFE